MKHTVIGFAFIKDESGTVMTVKLLKSVIMKTFATNFQRLSVILFVTTLFTAVGHTTTSLKALDPIKIYATTAKQATSTNAISLKSAYADKVKNTDKDKNEVSLSNCLAKKHRWFQVEPKKAQVYNPIESGF